MFTKNHEIHKHKIKAVQNVQQGVVGVVITQYIYL